nr:DNA integrity scanning protein DisA nucleotide-binding domain protein [bacterium]
MKDQKTTIISTAIDLAAQTGSRHIFIFLDTARICNWFLKTGYAENPEVVMVIPHKLQLQEPLARKLKSKVIKSWSGNQTRFSRIKYAFLHGVLEHVLDTDSKVVCVLGPWGKNHLDTIAIHDLSLSWSEEFPFNPASIMNSDSLTMVLAVIDIALDIGALGREGKPIGTIFVIGDTDQVILHSHQAVFNPFKGYPKKERNITRSEVVESIKELAQLDGAFIIEGTGTVMAGGRHLDARSVLTKELRGLGSRHRSAAGITKMTTAIAIVVSESTGRVTIFENGKIIST